MEQRLLLVLCRRQPAFTFCLEHSDLVIMSPSDETGGQTRAGAKEGLQEHGGVTTVRICDATLTPVPEWQEARQPGF